MSDKLYAWQFLPEHFRQDDPGIPADEQCDHLTFQAFHYESELGKTIRSARIVAGEPVGFILNFDPTQVIALRDWINKCVEWLDARK